MTDGRSQHASPPLEDIAKGALAGLVAGLVASLVMNQVQAVISNLSSDDGSDEESATAKAADRIARVTTGTSLPDDRKESAGNLVHYALGGALGMAYGIAAEFRPGVTGMLGTGLSLSTFALLDEAAVPAMGLAPTPTETSVSTHAYAAGSHIVFGSVTELARRGLRGLL